MSRPVKILYLAAPVICLNACAFCGTEACQLATRLSVKNLDVRLANTAPGDRDRVQRAFDELILIDGRCSKAETSISMTQKNCCDLATPTQEIGWHHATHSRHSR
jgi:hypothetical protein